MTRDSIKPVDRIIVVGQLGRNPEDRFDRVNEPSGDSYIINTSTVKDPMCLTAPFMLSTHFKKEADGAKRNTQPCAAR